MKTKSALRKRPKDHQTITTREWKLKIYQRQISRLKDFQSILKESQIKKKYSHIRFSSSKSKMNSSLKSKSLKEIDVYDQISFEEFHTDSGSSSSEESLKNGSSVLFDVYSEIHEHADGNWLFRAMSRGLTGKP